MKVRGTEAKKAELERAKENRHGPMNQGSVVSHEGEALDLEDIQGTAHMRAKWGGSRRRRWHNHHWHHSHHRHHWHHRHHRHHWHHAHHRWHVHHRHSPHFHFNIGDIIPDWLTDWLPDPSIGIHTLKATGDLCGFYLEMTGSVGIDLSDWRMGSPSQSFSIKIDFSPADLGDSIVSAF